MARSPQAALDELSQVKETSCLMLARLEEMEKQRKPAEFVNEQVKKRPAEEKSRGRHGMASTIGGNAVRFRIRWWSIASWPAPTAICAWEASVRHECEKCGLNPWDRFKHTCDDDEEPVAAGDQNSPGQTCSA